MNPLDHSFLCLRPVHTRIQGRHGRIRCQGDMITPSTLLGKREQAPWRIRGRCEEDEAELQREVDRKDAFLQACELWSREVDEADLSHDEALSGLASVSWSRCGQDLMKLGWTE